MSPSTPGSRLSTASRWRSSESASTSGFSRRSRTTWSHHPQAGQKPGQRDYIILENKGSILDWENRKLFDYEAVLRQICARLSSGKRLLVFFEPLKQEVESPIKFALHRALSWLDEKLYRFEMRMRNIPVLDDEYHHSDYQRQFGGIDPNRVYEILRDEGLEIVQIEKYCARRYGLHAWLANRILGTQNTFNLLATRP